MAQRGVASQPGMVALVLACAGVSSAQQPVPAPEGVQIRPRAVERFPQAPPGEPLRASRPQEPARAEDLAALVRELDESDLWRRMEATQRLREGPFTLRDLERVLRNGALSPEQRARLVGVARHRFFSEPRAAMGIQFGGLDAQATTIASLRAAFPAARVLRPGDRIIAAAGESIESRERLVVIIVAHDPGDELPVAIMRDGTTIETHVPLGEYSQLGQGPVLPGVLLQAWVYRSRAYAWPPQNEVIDSGLAPWAWSAATVLDEDAESLGADLAQQLRWIGGLARTGVMAGGEPKHGLAQATGPARAGRLSIVLPPGGPRDLRADQAEIDALLLQRSGKLLVLQRLEEELRADDRLDRPRRQMLLDQMVRLRDEITLLDAELRKWGVVPNPPP